MSERTGRGLAPVSRSWLRARAEACAGLVLQPGTVVLGSSAPLASYSVGSAGARGRENVAGGKAERRKVVCGAEGEAGIDL